MLVENPDGVSFGDERDDVLDHARAKGMKYEVFEDVDAPKRFRYSLVVHFSSGRDVRPTTIRPIGGRYLIEGSFETWKFLDTYAAVFRPQEKVIEAVTRSLAGNEVQVNKWVRQLPGVRFAEVDRQRRFGSESSRAQEDGLEGDDYYADYRDWKLELRHDECPYTVELSPMSRSLSGLFGGTLWDRSPTLKIHDVDTDRHDEALKIMETYASGLFFELDVRFGLPLGFMRRRSRNDPARIIVDADSQPVTLPRNNYAAPAVSLYTYARAATQTPLLEYLAYYQAIEFFFPSFWQADVMERVRQELRDPRFDKESDAQLTKLIGLAMQAGKSAPSERDQLCTTLNRCLSDDQLREFLQEDDERLEKLTKKDYLKDVAVLNLRGSARIGDQVADRVYDIRCRIVHGKENGGGRAEVLLPFGKEAERLAHDIEVIRFLAQKVIIAGSRGRLW
ncbi:hypothetical protein JOF41_006861 [Saccharothrix coeruleofusca]|uniref:hypothetical protein n=1 Tax=Saccharothrix coeruleofusca TaxID=33919 RepID=UPI001AE4A836|nr:hypothetical protein [Saccharothrix coeruleofusca]MBP2340683.1 hypothetical protein [Saccharothrix coeruleofusca]